MAKRDVTSVKMEEDPRPADDPNRRMMLLAHERLARHHALMIVCTDSDEVQLWHDYLKVTFPE